MNFSLFRKKKHQRSRQRVSSGGLIIMSVLIMLLLFFIWASNFELDEVTVGVGKVVPSSHEQIIQSLEGGILKELKVHEGDVVEAGQVVALLDPTQIDSGVQESTSRLRAALATAARLQAETAGTPLIFPPEVLADPPLVAAETALYHSRRENYSKTISGLTEALSLINRELQLTSSLVAKGAASNVEVLRLKRQANDLQSKLNDAENNYIVQAREELAKANAEAASQRSIIIGRADSLKRTVVVTPVRGIVKDIEVNTVGGVIPQRGNLMEIVPLDEQLMIEAQIAPRDVAFITPGQRAVVKLTAYDYNIYGGLEGKVASISPDTIQDEVHRDQYYYRVYIRTDKDYLVNKKGKKFPVYPGMIAMGEIHTGSKTIMEYLMKPLNRAKEALRER
ncbi:putative type I secretion membrane fusion protein [Pantoea vagans C9-1]|jgi:adhesin transport system membrane fusion protein|uniref:HlyD family efflux transporter periplasmic adaptor subunit n=1 Tax=Pantoea vagans TaxID=470934 RepID=UPI0001E59A71|nr:HlyD family efflux transporter periplasmic adaptor subunit [Pantoea vagans]ADO11884.1 putative type I secretion membrane fusion protein [Pantoea vagans C9-1]